jgi:hypothetical protein
MTSAAALPHENPAVAGGVFFGAPGMGIDLEVEVLS